MSGDDGGGDDTAVMIQRLLFRGTRVTKECNGGAKEDREAEVQGEEGREIVGRNAGNVGTDTILTTTRERARRRTTSEVSETDDDEEA